jgi:large subunit ribosomal protein L13
MKSFVAKPQEVEHKWYVIDAEGKNLGRLCSEAAAILRGKKKPIYTPHVDCGDYVIIVNAEKVEVTGKKAEKKVYEHHTGYPGGLRSIAFKDLQAKRPEEIIRHAVKGMMPKGALGDAMFRKLRVYAGPEHHHEAQKPEVWEF